MKRLYNPKLAKYLGLQINNSNNKNKKKDNEKRKRKGLYFDLSENDAN